MIAVSLMYNQIRRHEWKPDMTVKPPSVNGLIDLTGDDSDDQQPILARDNEVKASHLQEIFPHLSRDQCLAALRINDGNIDQAFLTLANIVD